MLPSSSEVAVLNAERRIANALIHPAFSNWLKQALHTALDRDPVMLANDLELLGHLLRPWSEARMARDADTGRSANVLPAMPQRVHSPP